jgi:hypothetical protein
VVFADKIRSIEAWSVLPEIDKRIAMKWIIPSLKKTIYQSYELVQEAVWRRAENVTNVVVAKAAHVVRLIWHKSFMHTQLTSQSGHPR